jgi:hypothetical protein
LFNGGSSPTCLHWRGIGMSRSDLYTGTLDVIVLKALSGGPMHGYAVGLWIRKDSQDVLAVREGVLYPALHRLERKRLVESRWVSPRRAVEPSSTRSRRRGASTSRRRPSASPTTRRLCSPCFGRSGLKRMRSFFRPRGRAIRLDLLSHLDQVVREEIRFYLEMRIGELEARGLETEDAWRQALDTFGDPEVVVLINGASLSSGELFPEVMKQLPNVTVVGDTTAGASCNDHGGFRGDRRLPTGTIPVRTVGPEWVGTREGSSPPGPGNG